MRESLPTLIAFGAVALVVGFIESLGVLREMAAPGSGFRKKLRWLRGSVCYWCGLLVLGLLVGVWVDSHRTMSQVVSSQAGSGSYWSLTLEDGEILGYRVEEELGTPPAGPRQFSFHREPGSGNRVERGFTWRGPSVLESAQAADGSWRVTVRQYSASASLFGVVTVFLMVWVISLAVAANRGKKKEGRGGGDPAATMDGVDGER